LKISHDFFFFGQVWPLKETLEGVAVSRGKDQALFISQSVIFIFWTRHFLQEKIFHVFCTELNSIFVWIKIKKKKFLFVLLCLCSFFCTVLFFFQNLEDENGREKESLQMSLDDWRARVTRIFFFNLESL
jgi:hypothetical protein